MAAIGSAVLAACVCMQTTTQLGCSLCSKCEGLTINVERLKERIEDVKRLKELAINNGRIIKSEVVGWLNYSASLVSEHSRLNSDVHPLHSRCFSNCSNVINTVKLAYKIEDALALRWNQESISDPPPIPSVGSRKIRTVENFEKCSSVETALAKIMAALKDGNVRVIGIHGIPGVGKTEIVKKSAELAVEEGLFKRVVFTTVSGFPDVVEIQKEVTECLEFTLAADLMTTYSRASAIETKIKRDDKVLIILDDIWKELVLTDIGIPSVMGHDQGAWKIVFTTRDEHVCYLMKCQKKIGLEFWSDQESREFLRKTSDANIASKDFEDIVNSVADECKGLPLALVTVAKALGDKSMRQWEAALERLRRSKPPNGDFDKILFNRIKLSFDSLELKVQKCFLTCCLYPEDRNIGKEELTRYMIGVGLFSGASTIDEARDEVDMIVEKLKSLGLLLPGDHDKEFAKMHDVIRDVAIQIASDDQDHSSDKEEGQVFIVQTKNHEPQLWPFKDSYKIYTAVSLMSNSELRLFGSPNCPKLQTLLLQDNHVTEIEDAFFKNINALQVLDLSGTNSSPLHFSIENLKMLRMLQLHRRLFSSVSLLGNLEMLVILSLRESHIVELPDDLKKLKNLRLLDLTLTENLKSIPPELLSSLKCLEELYLNASFAKWHNGVDEETSQNASFSELINMYRLTILNVDIDNAESLPQNVEVLPNWKKFNICICRDESVRRMKENVEQGSVYSRSLLLDTLRRNLPHWFNKAVLKKTEKLKYFGCVDLNMVHDIDHGDFYAVKSIKVQQCKGLPGSLLPSCLIKGLSNLEKLHSSENAIKDVFGFDNLQEEQYLGKLKEIWLEKSDKLETLWKGPAQFADFTKLKLVSVFQCNKLSNIFSVSMSEGLLELEDLWVVDCAQIREIIKGESEITSAIVRLPRLKTLCVIKLPIMNNFCDANVSLLCPSLEYLHILDTNYQTPASNFNSTKQVKENDEQHMKAILKRMGVPE